MIEIIVHEFINNLNSFYSNIKIVISTETKVGDGHSWHNLLPICAVSDDRKILLYDMELIQ